MAGPKPQKTVGAIVLMVALGALLLFNLTRLVSSSLRPGGSSGVLWALVVTAVILAAVFAIFGALASARNRALAARYPQAVLIPVVTNPGLALSARVLRPDARVSSNGYATVVVDADRSVRLFSGGADPVERITAFPGTVVGVEDAWVVSGFRTVRGIRFVVATPTGSVALDALVLRSGAWIPRSVRAADLDALVARLRVLLAVPTLS